MGHVNLKNIPLNKFRKFLNKQGLKHIRTKGGHEIWTRRDLLRPIVVQTHIDLIPEFIVKQVLRYLGISKEEFWTEYNKL
jgi:predicted RNA binding protein YcfA (HicA-like mRNA interferase family)